MTAPTPMRLMNPTLQAIRESGGSASINEITERVIRNLDISDDDANEPHGNGPQTELEYRLAWARTDLKKYGLVANSSRGVWTLTPEGQKAGEIDPQVIGRANRGAERRGRVPEGGETEDENGAEENASWQERLLNALLGMDPSAFERLCQRMLRESGFIEVEVTGRSGDEGIDGHGIIRMGGLISFPVLFQCKRYRGNVAAGVVRDFRGAMAGRSDKGLLITTGGFTRDARAEATRDGAPPIDLIDGSLLADKLKELGLGVKTEMVEQVTVDAAFFAGI